MADVWFISDTHFAHGNILNFKRNDGTPLRQFRTVEEMDECMMERWREVVRPQDKIYHLGDVAFKKPALERLRALPGHKRLVRGNHDQFKLHTYAAVFEEIYGVRQLDGYWLTHVPMHPDCLTRAKLNVHGHLHANSLNDKRYYSVCVENVAYRPVNFDEIISYYAALDKPKK